MDVNIAFLQGELNQDIYMEQPDDFKSKTIQVISAN